MYYVLDGEMVAEKEGFVVWRVNGTNFGSLPSSSINSRTNHMHYYYHHVFPVYLLITFCCCFCFSSLSDCAVSLVALTGAILTRLNY